MRTGTLIYAILPALILGLCWQKTSAQDNALEDYIAIAMEHNPKLEASRLQWEISSEKQEEVQTLPNTEFGFGYFISEPETRTGAQKARFSVKQMIPWFGSITARENFAAAMADTDYQNISILQRQLMKDLSALYYDLYTAKAKQEVIERQLQLLQVYRKLTLTAVETGDAGAVDVLKLQIRENELKTKKAVLQTRYDAIEAAFKNLLGKAPEGPLLLPDTLAILPDRHLTATGIPALHPELVKYDKLYESILQADALNRKEASPNLGIGLDYIPVAERTDIPLPDNGKDIIMPMVSLSIPIFNKKYRSAERQNELQKQRITLEKQDRLNQLRTLLQSATEHTRASRMNAETAAKNIKEAQNVLDIMKQRFQTGSVPMTELLDLLELQLQLQLSIQDDINTYYQQLLIINYLSK